MIPILYKPGETNFHHMGLGLLKQCQSVIVTEERNGLFEVTFTYPATAPLFSSIVKDSIVKVKPNHRASNQKFTIYSITKPENGLVTVKAKHISNDLNKNPLKTSVSVSTATPQNAMQAILDKTVHSHNFTAWSDISTTNKIDLPIPLYAKEALGGVEGSVLDRFHGEFEFDNEVIKLHRHRGQDNGVKIAYGKNLITAEQEEAIDDTFTSVYPYATVTNANNNQELITLPEYIVNSEYTKLYRAGRSMMVDFTSDESVKDVASLRKAAESYIKSNDIGKPKVNLKVSFINLWQTETYKDIAALEQVGLCDTVQVHFEKIGITTKAKVIRADFDALKERYTDIEIGEAQANLGAQMNQQENAIKDANRDNIWLAQAVANATNLLNNAPRGHIQVYPSFADPQELLILVDADTVEQATKLWRYNAAGWGFSKNGYKGPYALAATSDGAMVADMMTAGTLRAIDVQGVNITGSKVHAIEFSADIPIQSRPDGPITGYGKFIVGGDYMQFSLVNTAGNSLGSLIMDYNGYYIYNANGDLIGGVSDIKTYSQSFMVPEKSRNGTALYSLYLGVGTDGGGELRVVERDGIPGGGDPNSYVYANVRAKGFVQHSTAARKQDFVEYSKSDKMRALDIIKSSPVYEYRLQDDIAARKYDKSVGMLAEALPEHLKSDGASVNIYALTSTLWQAFRENEEEKQSLEQRLNSLEEVVNTLVDITEIEGPKINKMKQWFLSMKIKWDAIKERVMNR